MQSNQSTTSLHATAFNQDFEAQVNSNMNPIASSSRQDQKGPLPNFSPDLEQANDCDFDEKMAMKDQGHHDLPPRFSTIFNTKVPAKPQVPTTPTRAFESYPQQPTRKSGGVYIAKPLFWALFAIFMLESATLFAYTIIGLVNNMQSQLIHTNGASAVVAGCDCNSQPINISPNFYMAPQGSVVETTTLSTTITPSTSSSTTSTSTTSSSTSIDASRIADLMKSVGLKTSTSSTHTPTTKVVVVTPPGPTIKSTTILIVDASGNPITSQPPATSTQIVGPDGAEPTLNTRDEPTSVVSTSSSSGPGITITPVVVTTASDGSLVSVSIDPTTTSTTVVTNKPTQDSEPESSSTSTISNTSSPSATPLAVPFATKKGGAGIPDSVFMAPFQSPTSNVLPSMLLSLKSHGELAKPTHTPSSTNTVSTTPSSSAISTSTASSTSASTAVPSMTLSLKSHGELANKPTQDAESAPSSTTASVSTTTTSSSSSSPSSSSSSSTTPTPTITTTTPAPTPEVVSTFTITGPTSTLSAEKAKASCDHKKILGVNAIGCSLPADALDHPGDVIGDIFGGIGK